MDEFIGRLQESIEVVDAQLDFDRLVSELDRQNPKPALLIPRVRSFLSSRSPSTTQVKSLLQYVVRAFMGIDDKTMVHDALELIVDLLKLTISRSSFVAALTDELGLFNLMRSEDVFVRFDVIRIMKLLVSSSDDSFYSALLARPDTLADVIDITRSQNTSEFLRNEAIQFLFKLSSDSRNSEIHSILAYQGLPDSIFLLLCDESQIDSPFQLDAIDCMFRLCQSQRSSRYIRESGGCDKITEFVTIALGPVIDHAHGIASEDDPETFQKRVDAGWTATSRMLRVAEMLVSDPGNPESKHAFFSNGLVSTLATCGESLFLSDQARTTCFSFIASMVSEKSVEKDFMRTQSSGIQLPLMWTLFSHMIDERTPLCVRDSIDGIIYNACQASMTIQQTLLSMFSLATEDEDLSDPVIYRIAQSPGRISASVLVHALDSLKHPVKDDSALVQQVWFSLTSVSHFVRSNAELERSVINIRLDEHTTVGQMLLRLAKSGSVPVSSGAICVLSQLAASNPLIIRTTILPDFEFVKYLVECEYCPISRRLSALLLGLVIVSGDAAMTPAILNAISVKIGLPRLSSILDEMSNEKRKCLKSLPMMPIGLDRFVRSVKPAIQRSLLDMYLNMKPVEPQSELKSLMDHQQKRISELESELDSAMSQLVDAVTSRNSADRESLLNENFMMRSVISQLQREIKADESEIERLKLVNEAETGTLKRIIEDLNQQVHALLVNNKQLTELVNSDSSRESASSSFAKDHADILELLRELSTRFPETRALIGPLGIEQTVPSAALV